MGKVKKTKKSRSRSRERRRNDETETRFQKIQEQIDNLSSVILQSTQVQNPVTYKNANDHTKNIALDGKFFFSIYRNKNDIT